jgi:hypothetical protein
MEMGASLLMTPQKRGDVLSRPACVERNLT